MAAAESLTTGKSEQRPDDQHNGDHHDPGSEAGDEEEAVWRAPMGWETPDLVAAFVEKGSIVRGDSGPRHGGPDQR